MLSLDSRSQNALFTNAIASSRILVAAVLSSLCLFSSCDSVNVQCLPGAIQDPSLSNTCLGMTPSQWKQKDVTDLQISALPDRGFVQIYLEHSQGQDRDTGRPIVKNNVYIKFYSDAHKEVTFRVDGFADDLKNARVGFYDATDNEVLPTGSLKEQLVSIVQDLSELYAFVQQHPDGGSGISSDLATRINELTMQRIWALYDNPIIGKY